MSLKQRIFDDLKSAMKSGDTAKRDTLRFLDSLIKNVEIEKKKREAGLNDQEVQEVIARSIKQRKESILQYEAGKRADLAEKEKKEVEILSEYMPVQLDEEALRKIVKEIIASSGAKGSAAIGKVMGPAMTRLNGQADGQTVKKIAEELLDQ